MAKRSRLTAMEAFSVKSRQSEPVGSRGKGTLLLERKSSGAILGFYRERTPQSDKRLPLGVLAKKPQPGTNERSLDELRSEATKVAAEVNASGGLANYLLLKAEQEVAAEVDRAHSKRVAEIAARRGTFGEMLEAYVVHLEKTGKASARKIRSLFRVNILELQPALASRYANDIQPEDIKNILDDVLSRQPQKRGIGHKASAPISNMVSTADELRRYLRTAFNFAAAAHLTPGKRDENPSKIFMVNSNPAILIPAIKGAGGGNTSSLTPDELAELLRYLDTLPERRAAIANALIYLGGQRIKQLLAVTWECIDDESITLFDSKGRKEEVWEHLVPITSRISEILQPLLTEPIAAGPFALTSGHLMHTDTASAIFSTAGKVLFNAGKTRRFTWLEIRATVESLMAAQGISAETRAWILSHGRLGVQGKHYDRYSYLPEKTAALELWGRYLDGLKESRNESGNVVLISKRRVV